MGWLNNVARVQTAVRCGVIGNETTCNNLISLARRTTRITVMVW